MTQRYTPPEEADEHGRESQRNTAEWRIDKSNYSPAEYALLLLDEGRGREQILLALLGMENPNSLEALTALKEQYGEDAVEIITEVRRMGDSITQMRREVSLALPPDRETISLAPNVEGFDNRSSYPAPELAETAESTPAPISQQMPLAKLIKDPPHPKMSAQKFVENLTDEGRARLRVLLAMANIIDGEALRKLDEERGEAGFATLSLLVSEREGRSDDVQRELLDELSTYKKENPQKDARVVKLSGLFGGALFGKPLKKRSK